MMKAFPKVMKCGDKAAFCAMLRLALQEYGVRQVFASRGPSAISSHQSTVLPRFEICLSGCKRIRYLVDDEMREVYLKPGEIHYAPPFSGKFPRWDEIHEMSEIVIYQNYIRVTYVSHEDASERELPDANIYCHTARRPSPEVRSALHLLDCLNGNDMLHGAMPQMVSVILQLILNALETDGEGEPTKRQLTWRQLYSHLEEHFAEDITRESLARHFQLSPGYVSQLFQSEAHESFVSCIRRLRLEFACKLLTHGNETIAAVAEKCGYHSVNSFLENFQMVYGTSPARYRKETQTEAR